MRRCALLGLVLGMAAGAVAAEKTIDDFSAPGEGKARITGKGWNLTTSTEGGYADDDGRPALKIECVQKDPSKTAGNGRWIYFDYPLRPDASWADYEGLAFDVRLDAGTADCLEPQLLEGKVRRRGPLDWAGFRRKEKLPCSEYMGPMSREWKTYRLSFADLRSDANEAVRADIPKLTTFRLSGGVTSTVLLLRNLRLYRADKPTREVKPCVTMTVDEEYVGNPSNVFQPDQPVRFTFAVKGAPKDAASLAWEVTGYCGEKVAEGSVPLAGDGAHEVSLGRRPSGYYETRAWLVDAGGARISDGSVLRTSGTMPKGVQSFAVVPCTYAENLARMRKYREDDFFGVMNSRHWYKVHELVGAPWYLDTPRLPWYKVEKAMAAPPAPDWQLCVYSLLHYAGTNVWPKGAISPKTMREGGPGTAEYRKFLADAVRAHVRHHPNAAYRPYELSWEANLSMPPFGNLDLGDLVAWWKTVSEIVRANDPKARIWGPKFTNEMGSFEKAMEAGIGQCLDEISMHLYIGPVPEDSNLPGTVAKIRAICRKCLGRELPINTTEGGYYRQPDVRTQAQKVIRYALIQKGEGIAHYMLFVIFDFWEFGHVADYGLFYNPTWPLNFGPKQIYPKPMLPAYATMSRMLTGAKPLRKLGDASTGFFGYAFRRDGEVILALWNPYRTESVRIPCAGHGLTVTDIMGNGHYAVAKDGVVTLKLTADPVYVSHAETAAGEAPAVTRIPRAAEYVAARAEIRGKDATVVARFRNGTDAALEMPVSFESPFGKQRGRLKLDAKGEGEFAFAVGSADYGFSTAKPLRGTVVWRIGRTVYSEKVEIGFLRAFAEGEKAERKGPFSNRAKVSGKGSDGETDAADIALFQSKEGLRIRVKVADRTHEQDNAIDYLWRGDSLQIAFDTAPGYAYDYDEAIMQTRKKVSDIVVALGPKGPEAYRNRTYSERFLPTGRIDLAKLPGTTIAREDGATAYDIFVPWREMGFQPGEIRPGDTLGFSLLVNDKDGPGTSRAYYGLFGGIADGSGHREYGTFELDGSAR